jgi:hypothetical protein
LELESNGKGYFCKVYVDNPPVLYLVKSWKLSEYRLSIDISPFDDGAEPIFLSGSASAQELFLEMGGTAATWRRKVNLFNEKQIAEKNSQNKERIKRFRQTNK